MKELKDFLDFQKFSGASDKEIIVAYFVENDMEEEAMEICHRLAKTKIEKMKAKERIVKEWSYTIPSDYLYENYPVKNDYLINRPGRFHYHFRFDYPTPKEVREYLEDKLEEKYWNNITDVVSFSKKIDLNYDCLRAIAFELNLGETFNDAIKDLNIINVNDERYTVSLHYNNGLTVRAKDVRLDLFSDSDDNETLYMYLNNGDYFGETTFNLSDCIFDTGRMAHIVESNNININYDGGDDIKDVVEQAKSAGIDCMVISRKVRKDIHYAL